jgi:hypothetical protein
MGINNTRGGPVGTLKPKKADGDHFLLARGLSARHTGANTPLTPLTAEEMERDLRHMEAFSNACTAYSQQYFIYQNSKEDSEESKSSNKTHQQPPLIAMPVRIDPEEEKRLTTLRQKIQQCESQREVLESQYLSLRAHYVYLSQKLKNYRGTVNGHVEFLQRQVQKRGRLVALQRARLQMAREVLASLQHRHDAKLDTAEDDSTDLVEVWNQIHEQFKEAEKDCRSSGLEKWHAMKVPQIPPGVPLMLSQLAKQPGKAAAWSTGGMFGSKPDSLCWLEPLLPKNKDKSTLEEDLPTLRSEVEVLRQELNRERTLNKDLQTNIIDRRHRNDELVAMMALLRTETEAVVARHNILLQSDQAKEAADRLHEEDEAGLDDENGAKDNSPIAEKLEESINAAGATGEGVKIPDSTRASKAEDPENDGDDEGGEEDDDDGEAGGSSKRSLDVENGSPRTKRRKL